MDTMKIFTRISLLIFIVVMINGCFIEPENPYSKVAPGVWRGILRLEPKFITPNPKGEPLPEKMNMAFESVTDGELPFLFEVKYENENDFYIEIINGDERIRIDDIVTGRNRATAKDSIRLDFPIYDTYISALYEADIIEGKWHVPSKGAYSIPFVAKYGDGYRFTRLRKEPSIDITGKWEVTFAADTEDAYPAIGEFEQKGNRVTGTFRTETGDYRFLEGTIQGNPEKGFNKLYLSTFDGSHAYLFEAKVTDDGKMLGIFRSGTHYQSLWKAKKNPNATLRNPNQLTSMNEGSETISFEIENADGKIISPKNYKGKVVVLSIMGTWCPNCKDEAEFLVKYLSENKNIDLEVIGIAFEKDKTTEAAYQRLERYKKKFGIPYEIVVGALTTKKSELSKVLPELNQFMSYPTLIIIDKKGVVRRIHTGFNGPATSEFKMFEKEFDALIKELSSE